MKIDKSNWEKVKFGDVALQQKDVVDIDTTHLTRYVAGEHMNTEDIHLRKWGVVGDGYLGPAFIRKFETGDILYGSRRTYLKKVAVANFNGITSNTTFVIKPNIELIEYNLLPFLMLSDGFTKHSIENSKGSVNPYVNWKDLANYEFLLPPKEEQARLAKLLWAADEVVEREREVMNKIEIYQSSFWLNNYQDKEYPLQTLSSLVNVNPKQNNLFDKNKETPVSFITMADVSNEGELQNKTSFPLKDLEGKGFTSFIENDILFAKITPCMENGKGAIARELSNGIGLGSTEFHVLRAKNKDDVNFCFYLTRMKLFRQLAERLMTGSAGQKRVQSDFFDYYKFHAPSIKIRKYIGETMHKIEHEKLQIKNQVNQSQQLKSSLINQIF